MPKRKVSRNAACPCESGKKYKDCCFSKRFKWLVDEKGQFYRSMPLHPEVEEALGEQEDHFIKIFGRRPEKDDLIFFGLPSQKEIQERMVEIMLKAGVRPELIYAYIQTEGLIVTAENQDLIPDKDLEEWDAAIQEFRAAQKSKIKYKPDPFLKALNRLPEELERAEIYLHLIVREHGIARNISAKDSEKQYALHDYIFFCVTKSLKTLRSIKQLIPEAFGEDALILCRSIYENYLTINYLFSYPETINSFVAGKLGIRSGDFELKNRRLIVDKKTGEVIGEKISVYKMAKKSRFPEDEAVYDFLYRYLSEFTHPDIVALGSYLEGDRFDPGRPNKIPQTQIYCLFSALILLDILSSLTTLKPRLKQDLLKFLKTAKIRLQKVFQHMEEDEGSKVIPNLFISRLKYCGKTATK